MRTHLLLPPLAFWVLAPLASATDVTLLLVDQLGSPIPASQFSVPGFGDVPQGTTVDLAPGSHVIRSFPGLLGSMQGSALYREDSILVGASPMTVMIPWPLTVLTVTLEDQDGASIPASLLSVSSVPGDIANGTPLLLPVTEDPSFLVQGGQAAGYPVRAFPGLNGVAQGSAMYRNYPPVELSEPGVIYELTWPLADLTVTVVDQDQIPIADSQVDVGSAGTVLSGESLSLPVTEDPSPPAIEGSLSTGYDLREFPGILGVLQGNILYRDYPDNELDPSGAFVALEHPLASLQVNVVDQDGLAIPSSQLELDVPSSPAVSGATLLLPITEASSGPLVEGQGSPGYGVRVFPGLNGMLQDFLLHRDDPREELTELGLVRNVVWEVAKGPLRIRDDRGREVAGSSVRFALFGPVPTGTAVNLPITDELAYPTMAGSVALGYQVDILLRNRGRTRPSPPRVLEFGPYLLEVMAGGEVLPDPLVLQGLEYTVSVGP